ncbi:MAG: hypothetical protein Q4D26_11330 [Clostridia bacterium]|nr:hypothetical protein [Clostridia bacterium]
MREYTERVKTLLEAVSESSSSDLFSIIEGELNTRITAVILNKKVYGDIIYSNKIKIDGVVLCSEYNVLKANYNYLLFAVNIIKEKIKLEKMTCLYKNVVDAAIEGLTRKELEGVSAVLSEIEGNSALVVASNISKEWGVTRSVIINGLRKLECAGIIEMYSSGAKGTNIKILYSGIKAVVDRKRGD